MEPSSRRKKNVIQCTENVIVTLGWPFAHKTIFFKKLILNIGANSHICRLGGFVPPFIWVFFQPLQF